MHRFNFPEISATRSVLCYSTLKVKDKHTLFFRKLIPLHTDICCIDKGPQAFLFPKLSKQKVSVQNRSVRYTVPIKEGNTKSLKATNILFPSSEQTKNMSAQRGWIWREGGVRHANFILCLNPNIWAISILG
jgi:hypothetical protein